MDFEYVLLGLIGLITAIGSVAYKMHKDEIKKLKMIVSGENEYGYSRRGSLEDQIRELRGDNLKRNLRGDLNTLGDIISPLIEEMYKKDIELVLKTDHPNSKGFILDFRVWSFLVFINNYYPHDIFINERFRNQIQEVGLSQIIKRAAELRDLKAKLCCKKKAKLAVKKVKAKKVVKRAKAKRVKTKKKAK